MKKTLEENKQIQINYYSETLAMLEETEEKDEATLHMIQVNKAVLQGLTTLQGESLKELIHRCDPLSE